MGFSRQEYWSGLPFPSPVDHILSDLSPMTCRSWVAPRDIELDKAVVLVWLDWLVFCEYSFSVFVLWCPLATPTIYLGFLLPWAWGISSWLFQQSAAIAPYLGWGVSPHHHPSWPSMWDSSSRPSCTRAALAPTSNYLKTCPTKFPGAQSASLHPELPQELLKVNSYSSMGFNSHRARWQVPLLFIHWQCSW